MSGHKVKLCVEGYTHAYIVRARGSVASSNWKAVHDRISNAVEHIREGKYLTASVQGES